MKKHVEEIEDIALGNIKVNENETEDEAQAEEILFMAAKVDQV